MSGIIRKKNVVSINALDSISFRVGFSITINIGALVFVRGLFLRVVFFTFFTDVGIKWTQEAAVRYHAQVGTDGTP